MNQDASAPLGEGLRRIANDHRPAGWALLGVMALRDPALLMHSVRGTALGMVLAPEIGLEVDVPAAWAFLLHDLGTLEIPVELLGTSAPLTQADRSVIRTHPVRSAQLVSQAPELEGAAPVILAHHERWDGTGYPEGLNGRHIPSAARLLSAADAFAALTAERPHRSAHDPSHAAEIIAEESGRQFDPRMVRFPELVERLPRNLLVPPNEDELAHILGPRLLDHAERASDLGTAQLQALFAAALGFDAVEAAERLGRAPGTQRTWAASLRRTLACPPRGSVRRFLAEIGRDAFSVLVRHVRTDSSPSAAVPLAGR